MRLFACVLALLLMLALPAPMVKAQIRPACSYSALVAEMLSATSQTSWIQWIRQLSGAEPVLINGQSVTIISRQTSRMFNGDPSARAFDYILQILRGWLGPRALFEQDPFLVYKPPNEIYNGINLIVELPGETRPEEIIILSAHLDSLAPRVSDPSPGADDNATGVAALLEAARVFRQYRFERTLRLIFFTGEEQYEVGSRSYLADHPSTGIVGVINLDMIGYDADNDRCFEIHAGSLPSSLPLAQCVQDSILAYQLNLTSDLFTLGSTWESDHASFWAYQVPAVLLWQNFTDPVSTAGCATFDRNPFYHTSNDRLEHINLDTGFAISQAGIAAAASLARPAGRCTDEYCRGNSAFQWDSFLSRFWRPGPHKNIMQ